MKLVKEVDVLIVGCGLAGSSAAMTAARLGYLTLILTGDVLGGQLVSIEKIEGYPGFPEGIAGYDLCPLLQEQVEAEGVEYLMARMERLTEQEGRWLASTDQGDIHARSVVIATGSRFRHLGLSGEERLKNKGIGHCASCDAPLLRGKVVAVIGGGDSAMQEALTLVKHASKVILLQRSHALIGQATYVDRVTNHERIDVRLNMAVQEIIGDEEVCGLKTKDMRTGDTENIPIAAVFIYVGLTPNTKVLAGSPMLDADGRIHTDKYMRTVLKGVCAAGNVRHGSAGRAASAAGDGVAAAIAIGEYLSFGNWIGD